MKVSHNRILILITIISSIIGMGINSCKIIEMREMVIRCDPPPPSDYKIYYPFLPIERARTCVNIDSMKAVYNSASDEIVLEFELKSKGGSSYFGGSKPENKKIWCLVSDSVNGNVYNINDFTVNENIDVFEQTNAIAVVLDHSGSMGDRAYLLQDAVIELLNNKRKEDAFSVIKFDSKALIEVPFLSDQSELLQRFKRTGLSGFGGSTAINDASDIAVKLLESQSGYVNKILLLFTDGCENSSTTLIDTVLSNAVRKNIRIYIVDFGNSTDQNYISKIVETTHGKSYKIYQSVEINNVFDDIYGNLTMGALKYQIAFKPIEPLGMHFPKIKLCFDNCKVEKKFNSVGFNQEMVMLNINFEFAKADITGEESFKQINGVGRFLKENPSLNIRLEGHTDCIGTSDVNKRLSDARANNVKNELIKLGINGSRIDIKGFGSDHPHTLTADDLKKFELLKQNMLIGTVLTCDFVNKITNKDLQTLAHLLNRRTKMVILK